MNASQRTRLWVGISLAAALMLLVVSEGRADTYCRGSFGRGSSGRQYTTIYRGGFRHQTMRRFRRPPVITIRLPNGATISGTPRQILQIRLRMMELRRRAMRRTGGRYGYRHSRLSRTYGGWHRR